MNHKDVVNIYGWGGCEIEGLFNILENLGAATIFLMVHRGDCKHFLSYSTSNMHVNTMA